MKFFLCGFMGAGKSWTLNELELSKVYPDFAFYDLDDEIARRLGVESATEAINSLGMDEFRRVETRVLEELSKTRRYWLALGGGALENSKNQKILSSVKGYHVATPFEVCLERIKFTDRPLVSKGEDYLRELYQGRLVNYTKFPDFTQELFISPPK